MKGRVFKDMLKRMDFDNIPDDDEVSIVLETKNIMFRTKKFNIIISNK